MKNYICCTDFNRAGYEKLLNYVLTVYKECNITTFPIDCIAILQHYGFGVFSYSELKEINDELYDMCQNYTDDAFTFGRIIAYNEKNSPERIRFSLMHELGHFIMALPSTDQSYEDLADYFSSNILVPRSTMWHLHCDNIRGICHTYGVSCMAAHRILEDYKLCCFEKSKDLHQKIHHWFFPVDTPDLSTPHNHKTEIPHKDYPAWSKYHEMLENYFPERLHHYIF